MAIVNIVTEWATLTWAYLSWTNLLVTCLALVLVIIYTSRKNANSRLPPGPTLIPFIGCIPGFNGDFTGDFFVRLGQKFKTDIVSLRLFGGLIIILNDYEMIKEVFMRRIDVVDRQEFDLFRVVDSERKGIILTSGRIWKETRRFAMHMMRDFGMGKSGAEENILKECEESTQALEELAAAGEAIDPLPTINMAVSNVINYIVFGKRFRYDDQRFRRSLRGLNEFMRGVSSMKTVVLILRWGKKVFRGMFDRLQANYRLFDDFIIDEIQEHKQSYKGQTTDIIYAYLAELEGTVDLDVFNEKQLRYLIQDLFMAGSETTYTTLRWTLLYMAAYPNVQDKVRRELEYVMGNSAPSMSHKKHTPYTEAVLSEVQRVNTLLGLGVGHTNLQEDFEIGGYVIPRGALVMANLHSVHRDERLWTKPHDFYPENFLSEQGAFVNGDKLAQFSIGRRKCAGESLAKMELYLFFCSWIKHFLILPESDDCKLDLTGSFFGINQPKPHRFRLIPRQAVTNHSETTQRNLSGREQNGTSH